MATARTATVLCAQHDSEHTPSTHTTNAHTRSNGNHMLNADDDDWVLADTASMARSPSRGEAIDVGKGSGLLQPKAVPDTTPPNQFTLVFALDSTGSMAEPVKQANNVIDATLTTIGNVHKATGEHPIVHVYIYSVRDWSEAAGVLELKTCVCESVYARQPVPHIYTGKDAELQALRKIIDDIAKHGCYGGGDLPEEYGTALAFAEYIVRNSIERNGPHPSLTVFIGDDAPHGFNDGHMDYNPNGTEHLPSSLERILYKCAYAEGGYWAGCNPISALEKLLCIEGHRFVYCAVGNAADYTHGDDAANFSAPYERWLTTLDAVLRQADGLLFRYKASAAAQSDKVPSTIARLVLQHFLCFGQECNGSTNADDMARRMAFQMETVTGEDNVVDALSEALSSLGTYSETAADPTEELRRAGLRRSLVETARANDRKSTVASYRSIGIGTLNNPVVEYVVSKEDCMAEYLPHPAERLPSRIVECGEPSLDGKESPDVMAYRSLSAPPTAAPMYKSLGVEPLGEASSKMMVARKTHYKAMLLRQLSCGA